MARVYCMSRERIYNEGYEIYRSIILVRVKIMVTLIIKKKLKL